MADTGQTGERIAKVMARAGAASRRDAERLIVEGRVAVNGVTVTSPALDILPTDRVTLDGKPIDAPQVARLWLYYKPLGLVTTEHDEKGRQTVFESLPDGMPRVMSVGRLDLNSEGLLLLTNDGALKRRLELPSTGWLRKYRVRVNGRPNEATFDPLRRGIEIEGEAFQPMEVRLDRQQGANAWLTVGLREGKNREIRRAMTEVGLTVNRLIRVSYGPFRLNEMKPGEVIEVKQKVLKEQLGDGTHPAGTEDRRPRKPRPVRDGDRPERPQRDAAGRPPRGRAEGGQDPAAERKDRKPRHAAGLNRPDRSGEGKARRPNPDRDERAPRAEGDERKPYAKRDGDSRPPRAEGGERKPYAKREGDKRPPRTEGVERKPYAKRDGDSRPPRAAGDERKPYAKRAGDNRPSRAEGAERKPYAKRDAGQAERRPQGQGRPSYAGKPDRDRSGPAGKPRSDRPTAPDRPNSGKPRGLGGKGPRGPRKPNG
jgi:23S rRNA pseudouridine2605 synthase